MSETPILHLGNYVEFLAKMETGSVNAVITDPPYDEDMDVIFAKLRRVSRGVVIMFCRPENQPKNPDQYLFWVKPISTKNTSKSYSRFVEMICVWNGVTWNSKRHWSQYTNVFTDLVEESLHPFQKPMSLIKRLILNHTNKGDVILDPFMGSGTIGHVAVSLGRNFVGCEINKESYDAASEYILGSRNGN